MDIIKTPKIIILSYYGRSGSYFMHGLLDSGPNTIALPADMYIFWEWNKQHLHLSEEDYVEQSLPDLFDYYFRANPDKLTCSSIGKEHEAFKSRYLEIIGAYEDYYKNKTIYRFLAFHHAFTAARKLPFSPSNCNILYQVHVPAPSVIVEIMGLFANTKHVQMLRDPIAGLASIIKAHKSEYPDKTDFTHLFMQTAFGGMNVEYNGGMSIGVKLESLHQFPEKVMRQLSHFLDIPWSKSLLNETTLGMQPKRYDNFTESFNHIKTIDNNHAHQLFFSDYDLARMISLLSERYDIWSYSKPELKPIADHELKTSLSFEFAFENIGLRREQVSESKKEPAFATNRSDTIHFSLHYLAGMNNFQNYLTNTI